MPELPEVETTRCGIEPHLKQQIIQKIIVREARLRWPVPKEITQLSTHTITAVTRRGKYLLIQTTHGTLIIHLGMSGSIRILPHDTLPQKHDHIDLVLRNKLCLRFTDPRRFGCWLWTLSDPLEHSLLKTLGPEPLTTHFNAAYLYQRTRNKNVAIKLFIMNSQVVVGVGNIYANEALFLAGIDPQRAVNTLEYVHYAKLVKTIKKVLKAAIKLGGTTLRDYTKSDGKPGYFQQTLHVYGRGGKNCSTCNRKLTEIRLGQRSTVYCSTCQN